MIVFDGVSIDSVAPVKIEDIRVSPIQYNPIVRPRAIQFGSEFVRMGGGTRTVAVTFAILDDDRNSRHGYLMNLSEWAKTDAEYMLELPQDPLRYLSCVCTAKPEPSTRQWWESKLRLVFTCYDNPFWTSKAEKSVSCNTEFYVLGDAPPLMRIEHTYAADASNKTYQMTMAQGGSSLILQSMKFTTIPAGNMVIDLNKQTAVSGSTNIMQYYQFSTANSFIIPKVGVQTVTGTGTVKYRERWQ